VRRTTLLSASAAGLFLAGIVAVPAQAAYGPSGEPELQPVLTRPAVTRPPLPPRPTRPTPPVTGPTSSSSASTSTTADGLTGTGTAAGLPGATVTIETTVDGVRSVRTRSGDPVTLTASTGNGDGCSIKVTITDGAGNTVASSSASAESC